MRCSLSALGGAAALTVFLFITMPAFADIPDTDLAFLTASESGRDGFAKGEFSVIRPILALILLGGLCAAALYLAKKKGLRENASELIQVLAAAPVAQGVVVQIVDACGTVFVVALSRTGPTLLGQITDPEKISEIRARVSQEAITIAVPPVPFQKALERLFRKGKPGKESPAAENPGSREKLLREAIDRVRRLNPTEKD